MSQRSIAGSTAGFDRLPAHYRQSNRPIVVQPGRITCPSPTSLRKTAPSPGGLYRPPSATNLFAPPKSSNPLQSAGYSSSSHRVSQIDIHRAVRFRDYSNSSVPKTLSSIFLPDSILVTLLFDCRLSLFEFYSRMFRAPFLHLLRHNLLPLPIHSRTITLFRTTHLFPASLFGWRQPVPRNDLSV